MKAAVFLNSEKMNSLDKDIIHAVIFTITDGIITGIENEFITTKNINYLSLWLLSKRIEEVYARNMDEQAHSFLTKVGVTIKTFDDMKDNPLLKTFML